MLKFLLASAAVIALISPASASYTECTVAKETGSALACIPGCAKRHTKSLQAGASLL